MASSSLNSKLIGALALAVAACIAFCGCSSDNGTILRDSNSSSSDKSLVTFFGFKADAMNLTAIDGAIQSFMDKNKDVEINYESIKGEDYETTLDKRDAAGELDDVFMVHHDHVVSLSAQDKLADLSDLPGIENFTDAARAQFTNPDGTIYFLPTQTSTYNLYINNDLLQQHGQKVPGNWNDFKQVCDYFVSQGITPIIANYRNSLGTVILGKGLFDLYQLPEDELNANLAEFNDNPDQLAELLAPGVQMVKDMIDWGWIDVAETIETNQTSDDLDLFVEGTRPFMLSGGWASARVMAMNPSFAYGVYPYPILDDGCVLPIQVDTCISVSANSPRLDQAKSFVAHLIDPDVMWEYCDTQASFTPLKDGRIPTEDTLSPSVDYLTNGRVVLRAEYRLNLPTEAALAAATKALLNGGSAEEAQAALLAALQG